ncbi:PEP-CTERM sorting domain-containing protein [bacterium]|nr:PEP-CTERM sorting domain-containing protein [bacterium]
MTRNAGELFRFPRRAIDALLLTAFFLSGLVALPPVAMAGRVVSVIDGHLYVDGAPFYVKGIGYNASFIGSDQQDPTAAQYDIPTIAQANANNVVTYIANTFEWGGSEYTGKLDLQDAVSDACDAAGVFTSIGFWSPTYIDYTDSAVRGQWGDYYKEMVSRYQGRDSTLMYVIGNEVINNLPNEAQKSAYTAWIEELVVWTHTNDSDHPVAYADAGSGELARLALGAPSLDIYGTNYYEFETGAELGSYLDGVESAWPDVAVFLHEYGCDSYDQDASSEDQTAQADRIITLVQSVYDATPGHNFIGGAYFEFSDEWKFMAASDTQDPGNKYGWQAESCFDTYADEDYWGVAGAVDYGDAENRGLKSGYYALQEIYAVPEPGTFGLLVIGVALVALRRWRRPRRASSVRCPPGLMSDELGTGVRREAGVDPLGALFAQLQDLRNVSADVSLG